MHHGPCARRAIGAGEFFQRDGAGDRTLTHTQVTQIDVIGMVGDLDRLPAVDFDVTHRALEVGSLNLTLEAFALHREAGLGSSEARDPHALGHVERGLRVVHLVNQDRLARKCRTLADRHEVRLLVGERAGRTGQHTLHCVTGEVAGLLACVDEWCAHAEAVDEVSEMDRVDRAHLHALAALDTGL